MTSDKMKQLFEGRLDELKEAMLVFVKSEIEENCDLNNWDFKSLYHTAVYHRGTNQEVSNSEKTAACEAVWWFESHFAGSQFPDCAYVAGEWSGIPV